MTNVGWIESENLKSKLIHIIFVFVFYTCNYNILERIICFKMKNILQDDIVDNV